jgi:hypothetical protein
VVTAFAVAGVGLAAAIWLPTRNDVASAAEQPAAFADEFTGPRGTALDAGKWVVTRRARDAALDGDGHLTVSRLLISKVAFGQPYGHAEASIKVRRAAGPWRAFAVLDPTGRVLAGKFDTLDTAVDPTTGDAFHTYAVDWAPESIVWSVDGRPSLRLTPKVAARPLFVVLNLATDGTSPAPMLVDFVRVTTGVAPTASPSATPTVAPTTAKPTVAPTTVKPTVAPAPAPAWKAYTKYAIGDLVSYKGVTYKVKEAHTSLPGWEPTALPNLFAKV